MAVHYHCKTCWFVGRCLLAQIIIILSSAPLWAQATIFTRFEALGYSESIAFTEFVGDWKPETFVGGTQASAHTWSEVGMRSGNWGFSISRRDHASAQFSRDTAELYMLIKNKRLLDPSKIYAIDLNYNRATYLAMSGLYFQTRNKLDYKIGVNFFIGQELTSGRASGEIQPNSDRDYDFGNLFLNYHYSKDELFNRRVKKPRGFGLGLDGSISWYSDQELEITVEIENIFGMIQWFNSPFTDARIDTDNKEIDADGFVKVKPALSGRFGKNSYSQRLPLIVRFYSDKKVYRFIRQINRSFYTNTGFFLNTGFGFRIPLGQINLLYELQTQALRIEWQHKYFQLEYFADDPSIDKQKLLGFKLSVTVPI